MILTGSSASFCTVIPNSCHQIGFSLRSNKTIPCLHFHWKSYKVVHQPKEAGRVFLSREFYSWHYTLWLLRLASPASLLWFIVRPIIVSSLFTISFWPLQNGWQEDTCQTVNALFFVSISMNWLLFRKQYFLVKLKFVTNYAQTFPTSVYTPQGNLILADKTKR